MRLYQKLVHLVQSITCLALGLVAFIQLACNVVWKAAFAFFNEDTLIRASSLAFTTLLSIVPLLTVGLHFMNFYGVSNETRAELESLLARYLLPSQSRDMVGLIVNAASEVTQHVGVLGLAGFSITLLLMARELEGHILTICHKKPTWWRSMLHYLAFIILIPTGVVPAFLLLHPLAVVLDSMPTWWSHINYPFVVSLLVLMVMLRAFSNYVLSWRACAAGGLGTAVAAWASWTVCALYFANAASVTAYGALASIPTFMLWVFITWCCVLFGVQVAAKTQCILTGECTQGSWLLR